MNLKPKRRGPFKAGQTIGPHQILEFKYSYRTDADIVRKVFWAKCSVCEAEYEITSSALASAERRIRKGEGPTHCRKCKPMWNKPRRGSS